MKRNRRHAMVFLGTLSGAALLSGVAAAANPHGTPPGQAKQSGQATVHAKVHQSSHATVHASVHAQVRGSSHATVHLTPHSGVVVTSSSAAGNAVGVKASASTGFNTHAAASSSATKLYGNGQTAGQIAVKNGAGASAILYGPGNSQPHKTGLCFGGKMHLIDVHALKAHGNTLSCLALSGTIGTTSTGSTSGSAGVHGKGHAYGHTNGHGQGVAGVKTQAGTHVKGAFKSTHAKRNRVQAGVLGSVATQARPATAVVGTANFTG